MYGHKSVKKYLDDLAARVPAPGGGSAAALTAALGAALISMVVNFTLGKPKYFKYQKRLKEVLAQSEKLRSKFLKLMDLDVEAFRSKNIKKALAVPLEVCRYCSRGIRPCPDLIKMGNLNLISDVAVAAVFLEAAFASAYFNVKINLKYLRNPAFSKKISKELTAKARIIQKVRQDTEAGVGKIIRG